jgi:hypothetical protein
MDTKRDRVTDEYGTLGVYRVCWRVNHEEHFVAVLALRDGWTHWQYVGRWPIGPVDVAEIEAALELMETEQG